MNIRNKKSLELAKQKRERDEEIARLEKEYIKYKHKLKLENHIIFNDHKFIQILDLKYLYHCNRGIYVIFNKRIYKLVIERINFNVKKFSWIDLFKDETINSKTVLRTKKTFSTDVEFLTSSSNKYRGGYTFTASSIKQIIKLLYDIKFNNAKHAMLSNEQLDKAYKNKFISKIMCNRLKNNNEVLGFTDEIYKRTTRSN